ncbi:AmmeMemoRadiSam system protein B [Desulfoferrobacter suflitae]|uniref:AmmeMemoRadiSam system protein B n=1 Tax=Desulfoferrobacter suflitae TaxID=2865782 RepID=UPI0021645D68|nr:AmmeMemoRadiSam system protein B [Desulfoferrobacter suflitae]MCK8601048.1 AmmeMemoRadiSam system protein B [Desulfoferrobacter suflitae]
MKGEKIRESVIAGSWYPANKKALEEEIRAHIGKVKFSPPQGEIVAMIAPHAGYAYSGGVAAHAYRLLIDRPFDRVLIVAPSHRAYFQGASVYKLGGYRTPLGVVPLDREIVDALLQQPGSIDYVPQAHSQEHSLEIQLPFLQVVLQDFKLTPIVMGEQSFENCARLADSIVSVCQDKKVLLLASSDLSHFHSYDEARRLDQIVLDRVSSFNPEGLAESLKRGECEACGGGPMVSVMLAARKLGATKCKVLQYANSGDATGDRHSVVGYMAAALINNPGGDKGTVGVDLGLSEEEKKALRQLAYQTIRSRCLGEPLPEFSPQTSKMTEPRGAFVCVKKAGALRGCIGMIEARGALHETIKEMAVQAAFSDPRFCALQPSELDGIEVEISVLTPMERVTDLDKIEIGKHGLYIRKGYRSGLLLPQVAVENGWDREQFLEWTCRKAGLQPNAWKKSDVELYMFSADVF